MAAQALPAPRTAVITLNAGAPNTSFALVPGVCTGKSCPIEIELVANGQRLDAVPLEFVASDARLAARSDDVSFATHQPVVSFTAGEEEGAVTTAAQVIRLSPQRTGLLVQQAAGFEHVKRRRDVFIVDNQKLRKVWSRQDASGPVRSYADVVSADTGIDGVVLIEGTSFAPGETDRVSAQRLVWDEATGTMSMAPVEAMSAVVMGSFASAEAARARLGEPCLANYWVLGNELLGGKPKRFVLALLTPDTAAATALAKNRDCLPKEARRVAQFRPINEKR